MNGIERTGARLSLRYTPNEAVTADFIYSYEKNDDTGTAFKKRHIRTNRWRYQPYSFVEMTGSPYSKEVLGAPKLGLDRTIDDFNLTVDWRLNDTTTLTSVTGYREFDSLEILMRMAPRRGSWSLLKMRKASSGAKNYALAIHWITRLFFGR